MSRIPVFGTIGRAYGFAFGNLGTIIGLIWLPMVVLLSLQYYVNWRYLNGFLSAQAQGNLYELHDAIALRYAAVILALILQAVLVTPVMRQALGLRSGGAIVRFEMGPGVLRVFGAMAALALVLIAIEYLAIIPLVIFMVGIVLAAKAMGSVYGVSALAIAVWTAVGVFFLASFALTFVAVRLSFFVVPVAVAEKKIDLIRAWRLTGSNFWRIVVVLAATLLPLAILYVLLLWASMGFPAFHPLSPAMLAGWKGAPTKALSWIVGAVLHGMPYVFGVGFLLAPLSIGLSTGAAAAAYVALVQPLEKSGPATMPAPEAHPA